MITIGATTWSEHKALITEDRPVTLAEYAANFQLLKSILSSTGSPG